MKRCGKIEAVGRLNKNNVSTMPRDLQNKRGAGPRHAVKKWSKTAGRGRVPKWTFCSQVLLFLGKSGTLLQQCGIGMRKVSGFALFARKSHRLCSFSKNGTQGAKKQKAGLIPEYPVRRLPHRAADASGCTDPTDGAKRHQVGRGLHKGGHVA
jgi:hypothetical protein